MKQFLKITDFSTAELTNILDRADELHDFWHDNTMPQSLKGQRVGLWFDGQGFRNRLAFEIGAQAMGAEVFTIPGTLGVNEPLADIGHYLANWFTMLVIRASSLEQLTSVAADAAIPTINARTTENHPCEIIGDLQYIRRVRGNLDSLTVVFVGEPTNLFHSWCEAAVRLPLQVVQVAPEAYLLSETELATYNRDGVGQITTTTELQATITPKTDVIYTDCWPQKGNPDQIRSQFSPYQITAALVAQMNPNGFFLPCPPITRGQEVSAAAAASDRCQNYAAKAFLLHAQNALMELLA